METTATTHLKNGSAQLRTKDTQTQFMVFMSTNYDMFKIMHDNRDVNSLHVLRLVESFRDRHLICPLIVNENYEVIDGQHRLAASRETGMPVYYIKIPGYGIKEVQQLNTNQKNWQKNDYLQSYCAEGKKAYLEFAQFMADFPDFKIMAVERILTLRNTTKSMALNGKKREKNDFQQGKLFIPNLAKAYTVGQKILEFKPFFKDYHTALFVSTMIPLLIKSKVYNHKEMLQKLSSCPIKIEPCVDVEAYKNLLEKIYNYKRLKDNKVSFRYI